MSHSHFCAVALLGVGAQYHRACVLVQEYHYQGQRQLKLPGGMNEEGESPLQAAVREFEHETGLVLARSAVFEVRRMDFDDHSKHFFVAIQAEGEMRSEPMRDTGGEILEPPVWRDVDYDLLMEIFPSHKEGVINAIGWAAGKHRAFAEAVCDFLPPSQ